MANLRIFGKKLRNIRLYQEAREIGFDYILNPNTGELHRVGLDNFWGSHNLAYSDLDGFIGLTNIGTIPVHLFQDGVELPVYELDTGEFVGTYTLNKCRHCFT